MRTLKTTGLITSALVSAALLASPLAMADHHGDRDGPHGKRHHGDFCERMDSPEWEAKRDEMREKFQERHEDIADRLELTDEQRVTWDEIRDERKEKHEERMEKMKERCDMNGEE